MQPRQIYSFLTACFFACSCGATDPTSETGASGSDNGPGSGSFSVTSSQTTPGNVASASYSMSASFTSHPGCATTKVGACTVNPCYLSSPSATASSAAPNAGEVTFIGTGTASLALSPQEDGNYASQSVVDQLPWPNGGGSVSFRWAHFPGNAAQGGDSITLSTPPYTALASGSAFAVQTSTVVRSQDLTLSWTSDTPPTQSDQLVVDVNSEAVQIYCVFSIAAGQGVVPAMALESLDTGPGTYNVHSKVSASETVNDGDGPWSLNFNVDAATRTAYGFANGTVTIQ